MRLSIVPEIAAMQKEVGEGRCAFCEDPIPEDRTRFMPPITCGQSDCVKSYHRLYRSLRTEREWAKGNTAKGGTPKRNIVHKHRDSA